MIRVATPAYAALAIGAIPLLLYLIFRRRRKDVAWGAVYILRRLLERRKRTSAWKQYVIIALRTLAFLALALVFLRLFFRPPPRSGLPRPPPATHRVILLDLSPSMEAAYGDGTALDAALDLCRTALAQTSSPGQVDILPLDGGDRRYTCAAGAPRAEARDRILAALRPTDGPADVARGLEQAIAIVRASPHARREVYLVSDFSAADLGPPERLAGYWRALHALGAATYARALITPDARNLAVHAFTPYVDVVHAGQPTLFYVTLGYYGEAPETDAWLRITDAAGNERYAASVRLASGRRTLAIPLSLTAGDHLLTASLGDDDYPPDNSLARRFHAAAVLRLSVLQDIVLDSGLTNPREWLRLVFRSDTTDAPLATHDATAVAPGGTADGNAPRWEVDYANVVQAGAGLFEGRDGVILLDVDRMAPDAVAALRRYAVRGGTVLLAPGPTADPARFNETFAAITPARIGPPQPETLDSDIYTGAVIESDRHSILAELETVEHGNLGNARFYRSYAVPHDALAAGAEVVLALSDGSPLCVFLPLGRGGTLLWTAGLGMEWNSLVVHPAYPVLLSRLFTRAASRRHFALNLAPGEPLIADVAVAHPYLIRPDGRSLTLDAILDNNHYRVRYDDTTLPGLYRIQSACTSPAWRTDRSQRLRPRSGPTGRLDEPCVRPVFQP